MSRDTRCGCCIHLWRSPPRPHPTSKARLHGATTEPLLGALRIPYRVVRDDDEIIAKITGAVNTLNAYKTHVALVFGGELM